MRQGDLHLLKPLVKAIMRFDTAESYFYPPPHEMTMRNIPGILEPKELEVVEYGATSQRMTDLYLKPSIIEHTYDAAHLCSIHRYLFQDLYVWAGEYRSVTLRKQGDPGFFTGIDQIDDYLHDANRIVKSTNWGRLRSLFFRKRSRRCLCIYQPSPSIS